MTTQLDLLSLSRRSDPAPSHEAADAVAPHLSDLQARVLDAFRRYGPMSARRAERLPAFADCSPSTVRKRVSELLRAGLLVERGTETDTGRTPATVYEVAK